MFRLPEGDSREREAGARAPGAMFENPPLVFLHSQEKEGIMYAIRIIETAHVIGFQSDFCIPTKREALKEARRMQRESGCRVEILQRTVKVVTVLGRD